VAKVVSAQIAGIKELRKACKQLGIDLNDLKESYQKVGVLVLPGVLRKIHSRTGALAHSYKAKAFTTRGTISSSLIYAPVQEFGGSVYWRTKGPQYARVPIGGGFRMMGNHRIMVKPHNTSVGIDSYYVYPAFAEKEEAIAQIYANGFEKQADKLLASTFAQH
jgi:hypothetical protein